MKIIRFNYCFKGTFPVWVFLSVIFPFMTFSSNCLHAQVHFDIIGYRPAPGQFIDYTQFLEQGEDISILSEEQVCQRLNDLISKYPANSYLLSLGAFGGSVTVRMKESVSNGEGADFKIYGNAIYEPNFTPSNSSRPGGSAEPGIIWVSEDVNANGIADDPWYEIAGSEYGIDSTEIRDYAIVYYRPDPDTMAVMWKDNQGDTGYILRNDFHKQPTYFPLWLDSDSLIFKGARLKDNAQWVDLGSGSGKWVLFTYPWGYADNRSNMDEGSNIDIDWAVDSLGNHVRLSKVDFIRVVCAINQYPATLIGEVSTEFAGVEALHPSSTGIGPHERENLPSLKVWPNPCVSGFWVKPYKEGLQVSLYDMKGGKVGSWWLDDGGPLWIDMDGFPEGIYVLKDISGKVVKVVKLNR